MARVGQIRYCIGLALLCLYGAGKVEISMLQLWSGIVQCGRAPRSFVLLRYWLVVKCTDMSCSGRVDLGYVYEVVVQPSRVPFYPVLVRRSIMM